MRTFDSEFVSIDDLSSSQLSCALIARLSCCGIDSVDIRNSNTH